LVFTPVWRSWGPDSKTEYRLFRVATAALAVAFFVGTGLAILESSHQECTQWEYQGTRRDADRYCIGDYVSVLGPDRTKVFLLGLGGAISLLVDWKAGKTDFEDPES
jgi:hypothetical protein